VIADSEIKWIQQNKHIAYFTVWLFNSFIRC